MNNSRFSGMTKGYNSAIDVEGASKFYRHRNPDGTFGGKVDLTASVGRTVHLYRRAEVRDTAHVQAGSIILGEVTIQRDAQIADSRIEGNILVDGAVIFRSILDPFYPRDRLKRMRIDADATIINFHQGKIPSLTPPQIGSGKRKQAPMSELTGLQRHAK